MTRLPSSLSALVLSGACGLASLLQGGTAEAGRAHFSGGGHFSAGVRGGAQVRIRTGGGVSVHVGRGYGRGYGRGRGWYGGSVWVGGYYYPRPYYYYYPEYVPSYYYGTPYYPVQPMAAPGVVAAATPRENMPRFGIGVSAGGSSVQDNKQESSDLSLLARFRLTRGLLVEGEIGKTSFKDNERVDRRLGGSLIWEIGARNTLAPYLLVGGGVQQADVDGNFSTTQDFGEIGIGLRVALSRNLHITGDIRAGSRKTIDSNQPDFLTTAARTVAPPSGQNSNDMTEDYTRARVAAILNF